ncbi:MAG TPA: hypothetical protein EYP18_10480 [Desulfobacterales bacterium]|nr:hypothetical protein [Desulfobacterales bacterium]
MVSSFLMQRKKLKPILLLCFLLLCFICSSCSKPPPRRVMEITAYCGCSKCCSWERGSWSFLKLDFWNRYVSAGKSAGREYTGQTANGSYPEEPEEGFFSMDSINRPWMIPTRLILFPWYFLPEDGTIAADTQYYPFGTRMYIPGWGWGVVEDRGGAIKGPDRIDLYFNSHRDALQWGRRNLPVIIEKP